MSVLLTKLSHLIKNLNNGCHNYCHKKCAVVETLAHKISDRKSHCTNEIHFSDQKVFFSGRECHSPSERFERIDKLCTIPQPQNMQSSRFLSPTNDIHFSDRQHFSRVVNDVLHSYDSNGSTTLTSWT